MRSPVLGGVAAALVVVLVAASAAVVFVPAPSPLAPAHPSYSLAPPGSATAAPTAAGTGVPTVAGASPRIGLQVGNRAPALVLPRLGGGTIDLSALRGHPVWVNFMATWCPECQDELPLMETYAPELGDAVRIVLVDVREPSSVVAPFAQRMHLSLPVALDTNGVAQRAWAAYALPMHFWLDAGGIVRAVSYGGLGPTQFLQGVREVVPGASLNP
jgi:cytochrome c biogenesis protein CcmG/thiol:disulfide interchange protein DsbE